MQKRCGSFKLRTSFVYSTIYQLENNNFPHLCLNCIYQAYPHYLGGGFELLCNTCDFPHMYVNYSLTAWFIISTGTKLLLKHENKQYLMY